ncbi:hypothetical protein FKM82_025035 [Ascaphus truei]
MRITQHGLDGNLCLIPADCGYSPRPALPPCAAQACRSHDRVAGQVGNAAGVPLIFGHQDVAFVAPFCAPAEKTKSHGHWRC